jgi:hypothetical protein
MHRQPFGNRSGGTPPQRLERRLDLRRKRIAHPRLVDAMRA